MAGSTMTFAYTQMGAIARVTIDWKADDSTGNVSGTTAVFTGELLKGVTDPGTSGVQPDDNYGIVLTDEQGANILANCFDDLVARDETNAETVDFVLSPGIDVGLRPMVLGTIAVAVTSAGNANEGQLVLYVKGSHAG